MTGDDAAYAARIGYVVLGDPVPGSASDVEDARRAAALIERMVRLKVRHDDGELDDEQFRAAQTALREQAQREVERQDSAE